MGENTFYSVKKLSREENLSISYFLYQLCTDVENYKNLEESQELYNVLVSALGLKSHSRKVIDAVIQKHIKDEYLTPKDLVENVNHPFDFRGSLKINYKEDVSIYNTCGDWNTGSEDNINLTRAVFAPENQNFRQIIAYTFFYEPDENASVFIIPEEIVVPEKIVALSKNTSKVKLFIEAFKLLIEEGELLNVAYLSQTIKEFYPVLDKLMKHYDETRFSIYAKCTGMSVKTVKSYLRRDKKLISYDLIKTDGEITHDVIDCIEDNDVNIFFYDVLEKDDKTETYALNSFSIKTDESNLALRLLKNERGANILLYGSPGAGKTEYARALVRESGLVPYIFKNELEVNNSESHALSRLNCLLSLEKKDSVMIVDEAESMLSTRMLHEDSSGNYKKGTINNMLENNVNKVIWILNYIDPIDDSTLRRFTYSIHFREMSHTMLRNIADAKLKKIDMSENLHNELVNLCGKYHVTCASVDNMVKAVQVMDLSSVVEERVVSDVQKVLEANSSLIFGKRKIRESVKGNYDISVLNTSTPADEIVNMVMNAQDYAEKNKLDESGVRMLFYGVSGTGKTELARYIAGKLGKKIYLKRASDILDKYVGESEKNIAEAFDYAESSGDVLLFDEADSFFEDRNNAMRSWERTLVNEFLAQMEEFRGILICTTNLKKIMDPALNRRFHIITEFKPLEKNGIEKLLGKFFTAYDFTPAITEKLLRYNSVTPGDFSTLAGKIRFMKQDNISSEMIVDELCKIQEEKSGDHSKQIGFWA